MARRASVLVVAKATAASPQLIEALQARAEQGSIQATLLMPGEGPGLSGRDAVKVRLDAALDEWRAAGLTDVDGIVGDQDPLIAVHEAWDPHRYDEVIVSTLPGHASDWLRWDLPHRVARLTDAPVRHVMSAVPSTAHAEPIPPRERPPLGPLSILAWGHPRDETADERERRLRGLRH
jgi:hypothetical protein